METNRQGDEIVNRYLAIVEEAKLSENEKRIASLERQLVQLEAEYRAAINFIHDNNLDSKFFEGLDGIKTCPACNRDLPLTDDLWYFRKNGRQAGQSQPRCKKCMKEHSAEQDKSA